MVAGCALAVLASLWSDHITHSDSNGPVSAAERVFKQQLKFHGLSEKGGGQSAREGLGSYLPPFHSVAMTMGTHTPPPGLRLPILLRDLDWAIRDSSPHS